MASILPRSLFLRIVVRVLAVEWLVAHVLVITVAAIVLAVAGLWEWSLLAGVVSSVGWAFVVRDEARTRREESSP